MSHFEEKTPYKIILFDTVSCCFVLFVHQFLKVFQKAITEEHY